MSPLTPDDRWYQRAVFYEVFVRGFFDANGDGTGDLRGLTEKLDYLEWLGIDCIWLLPFYQSPLRTVATTSATSSRASPSTATSATPCSWWRTRIAAASA